MFNVIPDEDQFTDKLIEHKNNIVLLTSNNLKMNSNKERILLGAVKNRIKNLFLEYNIDDKSIIEDCKTFKELIRSLEYFIEEIKIQYILQMPGLANIKGTATYLFLLHAEDFSKLRNNIDELKQYIFNLLMKSRGVYRSQISENYIYNFKKRLRRCYTYEDIEKLIRESISNGFNYQFI